MDINFNEASKAWMQNKVKIGNGLYKYVCGQLTKLGTPCQQSPNCHIHRKKLIQQELCTKTQ